MSKLFDITPVASAGAGTFVTVEGADGTGKTTAAKYLAEYINQRIREIGKPFIRGFDPAKSFVHLSREPGGTPFAEAIRNVFLGNEFKDIMNSVSARTNATLMTALRNDHFERVIGPIMDLGGIVISDRYLTSTLAFQVEAGEEFINCIHDLVVSPDGYGGPHFELILVASPENIKQRLAGRPDKLDRYDADAEELQQRRQYIYRKAAEQSLNDDRIIVIDADGDEAAVQMQLREFVDLVLLPHIWGHPYIEFIKKDEGLTMATGVEDDDENLSE